MVEKYIELLNHQIDKLDAENFDLEAWKKATVVLLSRVFGKDTTKIEEVEKIRFEYGSWSLRDTTGSVDQLESCKAQGRGILEACVSELQFLGLEEENGTTDGAKSQDSAVKECIEEELKISQYKELLKILKTKSTKDDKQNTLVKKLQDFDTETAPRIVAHILTHPAFKKTFS